MRAVKRSELVQRAREVRQRTQIPAKAITKKVQKLEHAKSRVKIDEREARKARREIRDTIQRLFWNNRHWAIQVRWTRATIGEIFNIARKDEALLTFKLGDPIIIPMDKAKEIASSPRATRATSEELYTVCKHVSRDYHRGAGEWEGKARKAVRHPSWKEPAERPKR